MRKLLIVTLMLISLSAFAQTWDTWDSEDLLSGTSRSNVIGEAEISQGTLRDANIVFRFEGGEMDGFVMWGGYTMEAATYVTARFGDGDAEVIHCRISETRETMFFTNPRVVLDRILALGPDGRFVLQAKRATGVTSTARWIVGDLQEQVADLID